MELRVLRHITVPGYISLWHVPVPRHRIIIEFDGQQHFEPIRFGNQTEEQAIAAYHVLVENDERKNKWAKENDHHMIRIRYDELVSEVLSNDNKLSDALMNIK